MAPRRPSIIIDLASEESRFASPLPEACAAQTGIPPEVFRGMFLAAWAGAEDCSLLVRDRRLELGRRFEPSQGLLTATANAMASVVGVLGFGAPVLRDDHEIARWVAWASAHCWGGAN